MFKLLSKCKWFIDSFFETPLCEVRIVKNKREERRCNDSSVDEVFICCLNQIQLPNSYGAEF